MYGLAPHMIEDVCRNGALLLLRERRGRKRDENLVEDGGLDIGLGLLLLPEPIKLRQLGLYGRE